jgi:predicted lipid-binding transport protein (Tim44 family)
VLSRALAQLARVPGLAQRLAGRLPRYLAHELTQRPRLRRLTGHWPGRQRAREIEDLLRVARLSFVQLQAAWDRADLLVLGSLTTGPLLEELRDQLAERGPSPNHTEVLSLDARLLGIEELREAFVASVEFSGLIRERLDDGAAPFRELWLLANVKDTGRGWQLAQVQSLS